MRERVNSIFEVTTNNDPTLEYVEGKKVNHSEGESENIFCFVGGGSSHQTGKKKNIGVF